MDRRPGHGTAIKGCGLPKKLNAGGYEDRSANVPGKNIPFNISMVSMAVHIPYRGKKVKGNRKIKHPPPPPQTAFC
jgi:hypothetical protein